MFGGSHSETQFIPWESKTIKTMVDLVFVL